MYPGLVDLDALTQEYTSFQRVNTQGPRKAVVVAGEEHTLAIDLAQ